MPQILTLLLGLATASLALATPPAKSPSFDCKDSDGVQYRVWLHNNISEPNLLQVIEKAGQPREIPLSGANAGREKPLPGGPLVYHGWHADKDDLMTQLDMSNEFVSHYVTQKGGGTRVKVSLVVDNRERLGLQCKATGHASPVVAIADESPAAKRYAALIADVTSIRALNGTLTPFGHIGVQAALRRMISSPNFAKKEGRELFTESVAFTVKNFDPSSVNRITNALSGPVLDFWKKLLEDIRYQYYPEATRYSAWIQQGLRPRPYRDLHSVVAGFNKFVKCPGYKDKDIKAFFVGEITPFLRDLSDPEIARINAALSAEAAGFLVPLWSKAVGRETLEDHPEIDQAAKELGAVVDEKAFDPQKVQKKISAFAKSPLATSRGTRAMYVQAAAPHMKKLTPRQREDVTGWLEDSAERDLFNELLR